MSRTYLVIDTPYLAWRAFHSLPNLTHDAVATTVVFGILRDICSLSDLFSPSSIVWCFDRGRSLRIREFPEYKCKRQDGCLTKEQRDAKQALRKQIHLLRTDYLPALGYRNVFSQTGYEADDIIASVCNSIATNKHAAIIISADKDLYQCLSARVSMYNPRTRITTTQDSFQEEYGLDSTRWIDVKSMAGCATDNIPGIKGVGEATAAKFLAGRLKEHSKAFQAIVKGNSTWQRNRSLIELPYPGTRRFELRADEVTPKLWDGLALHLGMDSLVGQAPIDKRALRQRAIRKEIK